MSQVKVVVAGDITLDWNLARRMVTQETEGTSILWDPDYYMQSYCQAGGAALLGRLIQVAAGERASVLFPDPIEENKQRIPGTPPYWHSYAVCSRFPRMSDQGDKKQVWRVEEFLGLDRQGYNDTENTAESLLGEDKGGTHILVLHDANQGFGTLKDKKDKKGNSIWPTSLSDPSRNTWVLLRLARPRFGNLPKIWKHVVNAFGRRVVVVLTVRDLRLNGMQISRGISWERTIEDLVREIDHIKDKLSQCSHLVISLYTEGAVVFSNPGAATRRVTLYYDPRFMEGNWRRQFRGRMFGHTQCLVAGIALRMIQSSPLSSESIRRAVLAGLSASRDLHENGFHIEGKKQFPKDSPFPEVLRFPFERLAKRLNDDAQSTAEPFLVLQTKDAIVKDWTILNDRFRRPDEARSLA